MKASLLRLFLIAILTLAAPVALAASAAGIAAADETSLRRSPTRWGRLGRCE